MVFPRRIYDGGLGMPKGTFYVDTLKGEKNNIGVLLKHYIAAGNNGCWVWTGTIANNGYGKVTVDYKTLPAHRYFYEQLKCEIPYGLHIDHLCRNRRCVNPDHLEPVTCRENSRRGNGVAGTNARKTHCKNGHEFTEENTYTPPKRPNVRNCKQCQIERSRRKG
jgi:hypothetical protein